jgi:hypothetical protein
MKFGAGFLVKHLWNKSQFGDNRLRGGCTLLNDVNDFLSRSPHFLTDVARISTTAGYKVPSWAFGVSRQSVQGEPCFSWSRNWNFDNFFYIFCSVWAKFRRGDVHKSLLGCCDPYENRCSASHTLRLENFLIYSFHIYFPICIKFGVRNLLLILKRICEFRDDRCMKGYTFFYERKLDCIYSCTVKPYDILKIKNSFVQSVYCVPEYCICCPVMYCTS